MSFKVGDRVKIISEWRTGVIKDITRSWPVMYIVLRDDLFKGEKGHYSPFFEEDLEHIDPVQHTLNEGIESKYGKSCGQYIIGADLSKSNDCSCEYGFVYHTCDFT